MLIAMCGTHGAGKTSIARPLSIKTCLPLVASRAGEAFERLGIRVGKPISFEDRLAVQSLMLHFWLEDAKRAEASMGAIFDRSPIDFAAYLLLECRADLPSGLSAKAQEVISMCEKAMGMVDVLFYVEPHGEPMNDRGEGKPDVRNEAYTAAVDCMIRGLLQRLEVEHSVIPAGKLSHRIDAAGMALHATWNEIAKEFMQST